MGFPKIRVPPVIIHFSRIIFPYKPSICGNPIEPPMCWPPPFLPGGIVGFGGRLAVDDLWRKVEPCPRDRQRA